MPRLIVKFPGGPKSVPVGEEAVTIGRTNDNTIPIDDVGVSRRHVQILFVGKGYELVDMGSRNGTKVNGQKAARAMLKAGDVIQVGGVDMVFQEDGGGAAPDSGGGLEVEELDLGGAQSSAPSPSSAAATMAMAAGGVPTGECVLRFIDGERKGTEFPLKGARTTLGRRASNTIAFQEAAVSGVHCEITREANGYVLRDLGSTNGTLVDGEPVVETLLRHNSRIRVGGQRILFVDPTVADIESSLAGVDDALEWGLMRGEIDVTAARARGGRGVLVAALVLVLVTGGGAWWVIRGMPATVEVAAVKDNRISDFSFEEGVVRWFSPEEGGAVARIGGTPEAPRGASGIHCIEVVPQGEGFPRVEFSAASQGGPDASVAPDVAYEISAKVGSGSGAVVVVWVSSSRPGLVREVSSPVVEGGGAWPVTRAVVTAPIHATAARIQLAAFGGRPAVFDDVVFRRAEEPGAPALDSGELHVRIDAGGFLDAVRGGEVLLTQAGLAPSVDTPVENLLGASLAAPPAHAGAALSASGTAFGGGAFDLKAEAVAGGAVLTCVTKGGAGAFTFTCPAGLARGAVTLVLERTALVVPEEETFKQQGVRKIIVGTSDGPDPFVLSADKDSPGFSLTSRRTPRGLRVQLAPPAGAAPAVNGAAVLLSVDLSRENEAAQALLSKARSEEALGRKGSAAEAFRQAAIGFHYLPTVRKEGEENQARLVKDGTERLNAAKELVKSGKGFGAAPDLTRALAILDPLANEFKDSAIGDDADKLTVEANAALEKVRRDAVAQQSERLYRRAHDYEENGQPALQLPLLEEIVRIAPPGNDYRKKAETDIPGVQAKVQQERESLYGTRK